MGDIHEMIRAWYEGMKSQHEYVQSRLTGFMNLADPSNGSDLVREMSVLTRMAQGYQDLTDAADLPRGYVPKEDEN